MLVGGIDKEGTSAEETLVPAAVTDTGCERELNEDRYAVIDCPSGIAWLVCDGMGGVTGGELAAQIAIDAIRRDLLNYPPRDAEVALRSALHESNRVIVLRRQNQAFSQMGTTAVGVIFSGPQLVFANVGDSRAYLVRDGAIQQITTDHTYVQELVDRGEIQPQDALSHPQAHVLTRAIGAEPSVEVDIQRYWVWPGNEGDPRDLLVLCTDGLYSLISEDEIASAVTENSPQGACVKLVELAKSRGGFDNITLAVIPLSGELRRDPPPGYDEQAELKKRLRAANQSQLEFQPRSYGRLLATIMLLSGMAAMLVVLAMVFSLGR